MTRQRHRPGRRLSLEVGFEPRRGGQEALTQAYERLLLALSRPVSMIPRRRWKEAHDATLHDTPDPNAAAGHPGMGSHLRAPVARSHPFKALRSSRSLESHAEPARY